MTILRRALALWLALTLALASGGPAAARMLFEPNGTGQLLALPIATTLGAPIPAPNGLGVGMGHSQIANQSAVTGTDANTAPTKPFNGGTTARSVMEQLARVSGQRLFTSVRLNYGLGNDTSAASNSGPGLLARLPGALAAARTLGAGFCYVDIVGNNLNRTRQAPGVDGTTRFSAANTRADLQQVGAACRAQGMIVILLNLHPVGGATVPGSGFTGATLQLARETRAAVASLHNPGRGWYVVDPYAVPGLLGDEAAGTIAAGMSPDDLHYNGRAAAMVAASAWAQLSAQGAAPPRAAVVLPGATALPGALNTPDMADANADGYADGWLAPTVPSGMTLVPSIHTDPETGLRSQQMTLSGTPGADAAMLLRRNLAPPGVVAGGRLSGLCEVQVTAGSTGLGGVAYTLRQAYAYGAGNTAGSFLPVAGQSTTAGDRDLGDGVRRVLMSEAFVVPPVENDADALTAVTSLSEQVILSLKAGVPVSATVRVGRCDARWNRALP
ncbi:SGNH/GDSL hydrolase family protein [Methylobacterium oryzihabitans]|uniref:SGNH/GDSL hydrolase family protein n=1 Tax=Methylobacterium oryzihabitans TaxID=2499852 RepID=A0A437P5F1_9HYPH|nr:SGNH/GDSL hydrolase family protein [Methylobacterium oryzihabitans]RVU17496.1 SGNH/GDSL hydrolase family protein [Methylobacterium oryzihabitans]